MPLRRPLRVPATSSALLLATLAACAAPATPVPVSPAPAATDAAGYAIVHAIDSIASADTLWPGWDPRATPIAIFDGATTLLFRHPAPPAGFTSLSSRQGVWAMPGRHAAVTANTSAMIGGVPTATVLLDARDSASVTARAALALHELFHVYQRAHHPAWSANEAALFTYPVTQEPNLSGRLAESRLLALALASPGAGAGAAACRAAAAMRARTARYEGLDSASIAYERASEMNEGLANYVQLRALHAAARIPDADFLPELVRQRAYATGAAMGQLLDRLMPAWRDSLERDDRASLDALLARAAAASLARAGHPGDCALDASTRERFEMEARRAAADVDARRRAAREAFLAAPGTALEVVAEGKPLGLAGFDPLNVTRVSPAEVLHARYLKLESAEGASVEVMGRASLTRSAGAHPVFAGVRAVTITGLVAPDVHEADGVVTVRAEGVVVRAPGATVRREGGTIRILLQSP